MLAAPALGPGGGPEAALTGLPGPPHRQDDVQQQALPADPDGRPQDQETVDLAVSRELPDLLPRELPVSPDAVRRCAGRPEGARSEEGRAVCLDVSAGGCGGLESACLLFKIKEWWEEAGNPNS